MKRMQELVRLHRMGVGCPEAARLLQVSPNTDRQYRLALHKVGPLDGAASELPEFEQLKAAIAAELPPVGGATGSQG